MTTTTVPRLLNTLQTSINNLPAFFLQRGITNQSEIDELVESFRQQIVEVAKLNVSQEESKQRQLRALQLEVDFVKRTYLDTQKKLKDTERYRKLYNDALKKMENMTSNNELELRLENERKLEEMRLANERAMEELIRSTSNDQDQVMLQTLKGNFKALLRIIYPNDSDENIATINEKLVAYINSSLSANAVNNNLKSTIDSLRRQLDSSQVDQTHLTNVINRCNAKLNFVRDIMKTRSQSGRYDRMLVDLVQELQVSMSGSGYWEHDPSFQPDTVKLMTNVSPTNSISANSTTMQNDEYFDDSLRDIAQIPTEPQILENIILQPVQPIENIEQQPPPPQPQPRSSLLPTQPKVAVKTKFHERNDTASDNDASDTESTKKLKPITEDSQTQDNLNCTIQPDIQKRRRKDTNDSDDVVLIDLEGDPNQSSAVQQISPATAELNRVLMDSDEEIFYGTPKTPGRDTFSPTESIISNATSGSSSPSSRSSTSSSSSATSSAESIKTTTSNTSRVPNILDAIDEMVQESTLPQANTNKAIDENATANQTAPLPEPNRLQITQEQVDQINKSVGEGKSNVKRKTPVRRLNKTQRGKVQNVEKPSTSNAAATAAAVAPSTVAAASGTTTKNRNRSRK